MGKLSGPAGLRVLNMEQKKHFPLFCDIQGKKAVVIGGGAIAARRCRTLSRFAFALHIIAPTLHPDILELEKQGLATVSRRTFAPGDEKGAFLLVAATDDRQVNALAGQLAKQAEAFVSVADRREECTFYFPALIEDGPITIGVAGDGRDHAAVAQRAGQIRRLLEQ